MLELFKKDELAYAIGLLQTDGYNCKADPNKKKGKIGLDISYRDNDMIYNLEKIFKPICNVSIREDTKDTNFSKEFHYISLTIGNYDVRNFLTKYIPIGKKKNIIVPPDFVLEDKTLTKHYLRGYFDGDGSLGITSKNTPFISVCVVSDIIKDYILQNIFEVLNFKKNINRNKRDNIYNIVLFTKKAVTYASMLYDNENLCSQRKKGILEKMKEVLISTSKS
ncbi:hypothetical protein M0R19_07690 [Candidatus Pacearchaeota archaeon]|nr:hypothetical protein [bacterium]MCK9597041.1 hypothetical protein [Candidatus Pacearchaeota archaeon]